MISKNRKVFSSITLWILIALAAWPAYVIGNLAINLFLGESSALDLWATEPKRNLLISFIAGYKSSLIIAIAIGFIAFLDYLLLAREGVIGFFSGVFVLVASIAIAFLFYAEPIPVLPGFAIAGFLLFIFYKFVSRLSRIGSDA